jgi:hypothetical protein
MAQAAQRVVGLVTRTGKGNQSTFERVAILEPTVYYGQVVRHLLSEVATHQKFLSPGSFADAQAGIARFFTSFQTGAWRSVTLKQAGFLGLQLSTVAGFFFAGEAIGRRNLAGYKLPG